MNQGSLHLLTFILAITILICSCDKHHSKKLSGTYSCKVHCHSWTLSGSVFDTIYFEEIEIKQEGKDLKILDELIHIDSLWNERQYNEGNYPNYFSVLFTNDSVYITNGGSGHGGAGYCKYSGKKK